MADLTDDPKTLVSTEWLANHIKDPDLRIFDASWYMPDDGRDDIDDISDARSELPHMVPEVEKFMSRMRAMGVGDGHQVVAYDGSGLFSAARVWWLFRLMGKTDVAVLDGGLPKWLTQVARAAKLGDHTIIDARAPERFRGDAPEPREGLRAGHIPGSRNVFFAAILALALERIGKTDHSLYDGSWSEWGMYDDLPIATGAA